MGFVRKIFSPPKPKAPVVPAGPSPEEIRAQEEAAQQERAQAALTQEEEQRRRRRARVLTAEQDNAEIGRKELFGQ